MRHFYDANSFGDENFGTHYVVLAHELKLADASALKSDAQTAKCAGGTSAICWPLIRCMKTQRRIFADRKSTDALFAATATAMKSPSTDGAGAKSVALCR